MSYRRKRLIIRIILITVIAIIAFGFIFSFLSKKKGYSGEEWYAKQEEYLADMEAYAETMDTAVTLYITGAINSDDLLNYTGMLRSELDLMVYEYDKDLEENPLQIGTVSEADIIASESVRECYDVFYEILDMLETNYEDAARLRYLYQGYHQIFNDAASGYLYVKLLEYFEENGIESENNESGSS